MSVDIGRQKLRELCERATPGPWRWWTSCSWRRLSSDARGKDRDGKPLNRDGGVICPYVCRDGHPDLIITEEDADFVAASRTALPALLDLTDAQAAEIAELEAEVVAMQSQRDEWQAIAIDARHEVDSMKSDLASLESERDQLKAENASLRERADAPEDRTWFWEIVDRDGLANVASDERQARADLCRAAAERDQLRKQGEGLRWEPISTAPETGEDLELLLQDGEISEARWNNERYCMLGSRAGSFPPGWSPTRSSGVDLNLPMTFDGNEPTHWRLAAASALEQKEQG